MLSLFFIFALGFFCCFFAVVVVVVFFFVVVVFLFVFFLGGGDWGICSYQYEICSGKIKCQAIVSIFNYMNRTTGIVYRPD